MASLLLSRVFRRIDYQIATPGASARAQRAQIHKNKRCSDHAPLIVDDCGRL